MAAERRTELRGQVALVTGGGRGIGANIGRELADAGARVAVAARSADEIASVAREIDGLALTVDVSDRDSVDTMVDRVESELGPIDLLVNNAGVGGSERPAWETEPEEWWHVFEVNVLGQYLCCRRVLPGMIERGRGRIVNLGSGAAYLPPGSTMTDVAYGPSKAALCRFGEMLAAQLEGTGVHVFTISPGLVKTDMTAARFPDDAPWTPPELAPLLVRALASGRADRLAGRYIHAEHDDVEELIGRVDEIVERDLNAIRLRR